MSKKKIAVFAVSVILLLAILNINVPTKQGINYIIHTRKIPLYIKAIEFIDRDYQYKALSRTITKGKDSDIEKVMAILEWVRRSIKTDMPKEWPIYDDHILNIIIRGYGTSDQVSDVFSALCMYSGVPAGWARIFTPDNKNSLVLSFVRLEGKWRVLDVFRGIKFTNDKGELASIEDVMAFRYEKKAQFNDIDGTGLGYSDYFQNMEHYIEDFTLRSRKQMPIQRMLYECAAFFKCGGEKGGK